MHAWSKSQGSFAAEGAARVAPAVHNFRMIYMQGCNSWEGLSQRALAEVELRGQRCY